jgi:predicted alpha-1,6-mannanase (GH76 family)
MAIYDDAQAAFASTRAGKTSSIRLNRSLPLCFGRIGRAWDVGPSQVDTGGGHHVAQEEPHRCVQYDNL